MLKNETGISFIIQNLAMALSGEAGELIDIFQWLKEEESNLDGISDKNLAKTKEELVDIFLILLG